MKTHTLCDWLRRHGAAPAAIRASKRGAGPGDDDDDEVPIGDPPDDEGDDWDDDEDDDEDDDDEDPLQATAYCAAASQSLRRRGTMAPSRPGIKPIPAVMSGGSLGREVSRYRIRVL